MPISIDRFEDGPEDVLNIQKETQPYRILQFLAENNDEAFTQTEIHEATEIKRGSAGAVLSRLEDLSLVRHRGRYWAIAEDDRLASYATQHAASSASTTDDYYEGPRYGVPFIQIVAKRLLSSISERVTEFEVLPTYTYFT